MATVDELKSRAASLNVPWDKVMEGIDWEAKNNPSPRTATQLLDLYEAKQGGQPQQQSQPRRRQPVQPPAAAPIQPTPLAPPDTAATAGIGIRSDAATTAWLRGPRPIGPERPAWQRATAELNQPATPVTREQVTDLQAQVRARREQEQAIEGWNQGKDFAYFRPGQGEGGWTVPQQRTEELRRQEDELAQAGHKLDESNPDVSGPFWSRVSRVAGEGTAKNAAHIWNQVADVVGEKFAPTEWYRYWPRMAAAVAQALGGLGPVGLVGAGAGIVMDAAQAQENARKLKAIADANAKVAANQPLTKDEARDLQVWGITDHTESGLARAATQTVANVLPIMASFATAGGATEQLGIRGTSLLGKVAAGAATGLGAEVLQAPGQVAGAPDTKTAVQNVAAGTASNVALGGFGGIGLSPVAKPGVSVVGNALGKVGARVGGGLAAMWLSDAAAKGVRGEPMLPQSRQEFINWLVPALAASTAFEVPDILTGKTVASIIHEQGEAVKAGAQEEMRQGVEAKGKEAQAKSIADIEAERKAALAGAADDFLQHKDGQRLQNEKARINAQYDGMKASLEAHGNQVTPEEMEKIRQEIATRVAGRLAAVGAAVDGVQLMTNATRRLLGKAPEGETAPATPEKAAEPKVATPTPATPSTPKAATAEAQPKGPEQKAEPVKTAWTPVLDDTGKPLPPRGRGVTAVTLRRLWHDELIKQEQAKAAPGVTINPEDVPLPTGSAWSNPYFKAVDNHDGTWSILAKTPAATPETIPETNPPAAPVSAETPGTEMVGDYMYHVTYGKAVDGINKYGLLARGGGGISTTGTDAITKGKAYLTEGQSLGTWVDRASQFAEYNSDNPDAEGLFPVILRVKRPSGLTPDEVDHGIPGAFQTTKDISRDDIEYWDGKQWTPIVDADPSWALQESHDKGQSFTDIPPPPPGAETQGPEQSRVVPPMPDIQPDTPSREPPLAATPEGTVPGRPEADRSVYQTKEEQAESLRRSEKLMNRSNAAKGESPNVLHEGVGAAIGKAVGVVGDAVKTVLEPIHRQGALDNRAKQLGIEPTRGTITGLVDRTKLAADVMDADIKSGKWGHDKTDAMQQYIGDIGQAEDTQSRLDKHLTQTMTDAIKGNPALTKLTGSPFWPSNLTSFGEALGVIANMEASGKAQLYKDLYSKFPEGLKKATDLAWKIQADPEVMKAVRPVLDWYRDQYYPQMFDAGYAAGTQRNRRSAYGLSLVSQAEREATGLEVPGEHKMDTKPRSSGPREIDTWAELAAGTREQPKRDVSKGLDIRKNAVQWYAENARSAAANSYVERMLASGTMFTADGEIEVNGRRYDNGVEGALTDLYAEQKKLLTGSEGTKTQEQLAKAMAERDRLVELQRKQVEEPSSMSKPKIKADPQVTRDLKSIGTKITKLQNAGAGALPMSQRLNEVDADIAKLETLKHVDRDVLAYKTWESNGYAETQAKLEKAVAARDAAAVNKDVGPDAYKKWLKAGEKVQGLQDKLKELERPYQWRQSHDLYATPRTADWLKMMAQPSNMGQWWGQGRWYGSAKIKEASDTSKKVKVLLGGFHPTAFLQTYLTGALPRVMRDPVSAFSNGLHLYDEWHPILDEALKSGMMTSPVRQQEWGEGGQRKWTQLWDKTTGGMQKLTFEKWGAGLKTSTFIHEAWAIHDEHPDWSVEKVMQLATNTTTYFYGGVNRRWFPRNATLQDIVGVMTFSPDWTEGSLIRPMRDMLSGVMTEGKPWQEFKMRDPAMFRNVAGMTARYLVTNFVLNNMIQATISKARKDDKLFTWQQDYLKGMKLGEKLLYNLGAFVDIGKIFNFAEDAPNMVKILQPSGPMWMFGQYLLVPAMAMALARDQGDIANSPIWNTWLGKLGQFPRAAMTLAGPPQPHRRYTTLGELLETHQTSAPDYVPVAKKDVPSDKLNPRTQFYDDMANQRWRDKYRGVWGTQRNVKGIQVLGTAPSRVIQAGRDLAEPIFFAPIEALILGGMGWQEAVINAITGTRFRKVYPKQ